jgi:subtilisin family serine protease
LLLIALLLTPALASGRQGQGTRASDDVRAAVATAGVSEVIVRVRQAFQMEGRLDRSAALAQRARLRDRQARIIDRLPRGVRARRFQLTPYFAARVDAAALARLESDPDVVSIEADKRMHADLAESGRLVGAPETWALGFTGNSWTIAVLDTGIDAAHPFLTGKVASEACYSDAGGTSSGTSLCPGGAASSTASGSARPCSISGCDHGTHVAGIAAGIGTNVSGIGRDARLMSMQIFTRFDTSSDCGFVTPCLLSYTSDVILALERVFALRDTHNIAAVNMSFGAGRYFSQASCDADNASLKAAIDQLRSVGIATVASSGNEGFFNSMSAPACISSAVSVGSTNKNDQLSGFTNAASFLHLLAPGSTITSSVPGGGVDVKSGTSMSAPHVSGAWALLKQRRPTASVPQVLNALRSTGLGVTDTLSGLSYPRIRIASAAAALLPTQLVVDTPASGHAVSLPLRIGGWALDPLASAGTGVNAVHLWAHPDGGSPAFLGVAQYGGSRPDVAALYGARFADSGFDMTVSSLAPGRYRLIVYAHNVASGRFETAQVVSVTIGGQSQPMGAIDAPAAGATVTSPFQISGWTLDRAATAGTGVDAVHVYAYPAAGGSPAFLGAASHGLQRADVGAAFGASFASSGYVLTANLAPGAYRIVVFSRSTVSGAFTSQTANITVRARGDALLSIDTPVSGATVSGSFLIGGWALDRDSTSGTGIDTVHVWAYPASGGPPSFLGVAAYGGARPDVAAVFGGRFVWSGFHLVTAGLSAGVYDVVAYGHSTVTNAFSVVKVVRVVVP